METTTTKPIIKWAGGKRQVMSQIIKFFPKNICNFYELFVGGGSVFLELLQNEQFNIKKVYINDLMSSLIIMYETIKKNPEFLIDELSKDIYTNNLEAFLKIKEEFNILKSKKNHDLKIAAMFIYLNRIGFNGMYRENSKGLYNIPFGKQKNPTICNKTGIKNLSQVLQSVNISNCTFSDYKIKNISCDDFIYLDPPYHNTFTGYNKNSFDESEQIKLKEYVDKLGCKVAISNSNTEFIRNLYKDYNLHEIETKRLINSKKEKRSDIILELLITNY